MNKKPSKIIPNLYLLLPAYNNADDNSDFFLLKVSDDLMTTIKKGRKVIKEAKSLFKSDLSALLLYNPWGEFYADSEQLPECVHEKGALLTKFFILPSSFFDTLSKPDFYPDIHNLKFSSDGSFIFVSHLDSGSEYWTDSCYDELDIIQKIMNKRISQEQRNRYYEMLASEDWETVNLAKELLK